VNIKKLGVAVRRSKYLWSFVLRLPLLFLFEWWVVYLVDLIILAFGLCAIIYVLILKFYLNEKVKD